MFQEFLQWFGVTFVVVLGAVIVYGLATLLIDLWNMNND